MRLIIVIMALFPVFAFAEPSHTDGVTIQYNASGNLSTYGTGIMPTIKSGFGTRAALVAGIGVNSFYWNVGSGGVATTGTFNMPPAPDGWNCNVNDITNPGVSVTGETSSTTTSVTFVNYSFTSGLVAAWTANDILAIHCDPY